MKIEVPDYMLLFGTPELSERGYSLVKMEELNAALKKATEKLKEDVRLYIKSYYLIALTSKADPERVPVMALDLIKELEAAYGLKPLLPLEDILKGNDDLMLLAALKLVVS